MRALLEACIGRFPPNVESHSPVGNLHEAVVVAPRLVPVLAVGRNSGQVDNRAAARSKPGDRPGPADDAFDEPPLQRGDEIDVFVFRIRSR
jgi:hypothetical protein